MTEQESALDIQQQILGQMIEMVNAGGFDSYIKLLERSVAIRKQQIQRKLVAELCVGDRIVLVDTIKPQLLAGITVEVTDIQHDKIKVMLQRTYSTKWRNGGIVTITPGLIAERL